ncbi:hypothetical protein FG386_001331 [Cryptosporidium ryanae]|uniref:uncharacterized protein n=1 Tax=Cryptosporidium ryanae TaxID=515981 RepID=UPI003519EA70|nr:hypothetical protein FG386_001331 [Cryptosporidium ryanae]
MLHLSRIIVVYILFYYVNKEATCHGTNNYKRDLEDLRSDSANFENISGNCLKSYSNFMDKFKKISKNSILWPKLNTNEDKKTIRHNLSEKFSVFSTLISIKKIFQLGMNNSMNYDNVDSIKLIKFFIFLIENYEQSDMYEYLTESDRSKVLEAKNRLISNSIFLNVYYYSSNVKREFFKEYKINSFNKAIIQLFLHPAYLDIYNYGELILSRTAKGLVY